MRMNRTGLSTAVIGVLLLLTGCAGASAASTPQRAGVAESAAPAVAAAASAVALDCARESARDTPECTGTFPPGVPPTSGQAQLGEGDAIAAARHGYGAPDDAPARARLIHYSDWVTTYGGSATPLIDDARPVWIVSVSFPPTFPSLGPPGSTIAASPGYTVLIDSYSGVPIEFVNAEREIVE